MKHYVINLKSRPDRLSNFLRDNKPHAEKISVFEAVDGKVLSRSDLVQAGLVLEANCYDAIGLAVALSHIQLWKLCLESGQPITIMEDDSVLTDDFFDIQKDLITQNPDFDIFVFGFNSDWPLEISFGNGLPKATVLFEKEKEQFLKSKSYGAPKIEAFAGCCCYTITPACAEKFLQMLLPLDGGFYPLRVFSALYGGDFTRTAWKNSGIDVAISMCLHRVNGRVCLPPIAVPHNDWADSSFDRTDHQAT
ncbi:glycosyltransferase [Acetobacter indonesiensis NRIC 0313]|uniref:Glycosyl transferase family 25 domain-containing protein n=1 Tax=Acetobacter indonesiensis TaxID=104101 RepID=A0A6N3T5F0_9PROT|nr:glycosyltransferase family 25 protein [Acetobacter indonesiensis]GAN63013.1 hypothetical protein Abin_016_021 [Acetobacter indonesiensis]GBQ57398.1 glycosyltransferase [Acetobacter indonesiensis NRIC 0313]GEN04506.1 hypothetical protein AIN02nite_25310 [Acetobacter indonesiensis]